MIPASLFTGSALAAKSALCPNTPCCKTASITGGDLISCTCVWMMSRWLIRVRPGSYASCIAVKFTPRLSISSRDVAV